MPEQEMPRYIGPDTSGRKDKLTRQEIKDRFDREVAALYAKREPVWLPESGGIFDLIVDVISPFLEAGGYILDIGAGTGNLTQTILERVPSARATLLDFSENMLSQAPRVLSAFAGRFDAIVSDFIQDELPDRQYHAVVSSFAIHHCRSEAEYLALYKKIRNVLKKPGIFVCCFRRVRGLGRVNGSGSLAGSGTGLSLPAGRKTGGAEDRRVAAGKGPFAKGLMAEKAPTDRLVMFSCDHIEAGSKAANIVYH